MVPSAKNLKYDNANNFWKVKYHLKIYRRKPFKLFIYRTCHPTTMKFSSADNMPEKHIFINLVFYFCQFS